MIDNIYAYKLGQYHEVKPILDVNLRFYIYIGKRNSRIIQHQTGTWNRDYQLKYFTLASIEYEWIKNEVDWRN